MFPTIKSGIRSKMELIFWRGREVKDLSLIEIV
jgi:hypothetical protein